MFQPRLIVFRNPFPSISLPSFLYFCHLPNITSAQKEEIDRGGGNREKRQKKQISRLSVIFAFSALFLHRKKTRTAKKWTGKKRQKSKYRVCWTERRVWRDPIWARAWFCSYYNFIKATFSHIWQGVGLFCVLFIFMNFSISVIYFRKHSGMCNTMLEVYNCFFITTTSASFSLLKGDFYLQPSQSQCFSILKLPNLKWLLEIILVHAFANP